MKNRKESWPLLLLGLFTSGTLVATEIETVVVSGTRTEVAASDAPNNISVLTQEQLRVTQAEHIQQSLNQVPGVSLQRGDGQESLPGIRSAVLTGAGACGSVLVLEEGIPVRGPAFCNVNELFDTHFEHAGQIEVTRGPGTSFYGSNSLTGSINVLMPKSVQDSVSLEIGDHSYKRAKAHFAYGRSSESSGQLFATLTDTDSFREESGYQQQKLSWRHRQEFGEWSAKLGITATHLDQQTAGFIQGLNSYQDKQLSSQNLNPEAYRESDSIRAWASFSKQTESGLDLTITPFVRSTDMQFLMHFLPGTPLETNQQQGVGWQAAIANNDNDRFKWALGVDADFSTGELTQSQQGTTQGSAFLVETVPTGTHYDYIVDAQQIGLFAHADWQLADSWQLILGARAERLEYDYDNLSLDGRTRDDGSSCGFGGCRYSRPADRSDAFKELSPKLELRYQPQDNLRLYFSLASSFRAPQATELYRLQRQQQVAELDSVRADNVEFGLAYFGGSSYVSASVYRLSQRNVIIRDSDFFNVDDNKLNSTGFELALKQTMSQKLNARVALSLAKHEYASDQISGGVNINGNEVDTAPTSQLNAALNWQPTDNIKAQLELVHVGSYFLEPENQHQYPGHEVINFRSSYQINDQLSASLRLLNVADERYAERADFTQFTAERYFPGAPRSVYVGLRYQFGQ